MLVSTTAVVSKVPLQTRNVLLVVEAGSREKGATRGKVVFAVVMSVSMVC